MLAEDLGKPLTAVRDPFGEHESFGAHNNARLRAFLDGFGFDYEFMSSTECYRVRPVRRGAAAHRWSGSTRPGDHAADAGTRAPRDLFAVPADQPDHRAGAAGPHPGAPRRARDHRLRRRGRRPDRSPGHRRRGEAAVEARLGLPLDGAGVDYEMSGKDLIDSVKRRSTICQVLGGEPPEGFNYELFLDENNQKISKSKGNGLTMEEWLRYGAPESLAYYMFQSPRSAKRLYFDVIPKATDEYLQQLDAFNRPARTRTADAAPLDNPVWSVHGGAPPEPGSPVIFSLLLNLVSAANASDKALLWGFLARYFPGATPADAAAARPARRLRHQLLRGLRAPDEALPRARRPRARGDGGSARAAEGPAGRLPGRRDDPERGLRGRQGRRVRAAARLVRRALRGAAGPDPGPALRLLRRDLRRRRKPWR